MNEKHIHMNRKDFFAFKYQHDCLNLQVARLTEQQNRIDMILV